MYTLNEDVRVAETCFLGRNKPEGLSCRIEEATSRCAGYNRREFSGYFALPQKEEVVALSLEKMLDELLYTKGLSELYGNGAGIVAAAHLLYTR